MKIGILKSVNDDMANEPHVPSKALIACRNNTGVLLEWTGSSINWHVSEISDSLEDLDLHDAPDGLSVWEGEMGSERYDTMEGTEWDFVVTGKFRPLTPEEWTLFQTKGQLWPFEEKNDAPPVE